jgi:hypothetical protein
VRRIAISLLGAAVVWLTAAGAARADVYDDNPATASRGPGTVCR